MNLRNLLNQRENYSSHRFFRLFSLLLIQQITQIPQKIHGICEFIVFYARNLSFR